MNSFAITKAKVSSTFSSLHLGIIWILTSNFHSKPEVEVVYSSDEGTPRSGYQTRRSLFEASLRYLFATKGHPCEARLRKAENVQAGGCFRTTVTSRSVS